jgi:hypothetical protein
MYSNCFYLLHGEALDYKTPCCALHDEAATDVCKYFDKIKKAATLGWEQEYF